MYFQRILDVNIGTIIDFGNTNAELDLWYQYWSDAFTPELERKCASIAHDGKRKLYLHYEF